MDSMSLAEFLTSHLPSMSVCRRLVLQSAIKLNGVNVEDLDELDQRVKTGDIVRVGKKTLNTSAPSL